MFLVSLTSVMMSTMTIKKYRSYKSKDKSVSIVIYDDILVIKDLDENQIIKYNYYKKKGKIYCQSLNSGSDNKILYIDNFWTGRLYLKNGIKTTSYICWSEFIISKIMLILLLIAIYFLIADGIRIYKIIKKEQNYI